MQNKKWNNYYIMHFCQDPIVKALRALNLPQNRHWQRRGEIRVVSRPRYRAGPARPRPTAQPKRDVTGHTDSTKKPFHRWPHNTQLTSFVGVKGNNLYIMHFCQNAIVKTLRAVEHVTSGTRVCVGIHTETGDG